MLEEFRKAYNSNKVAIKYVKSKVMKYQEKVESAQSKAQEEFDNCMGDILDSTCVQCIPLQIMQINYGLCRSAFYILYTIPLILRLEGHVGDLDLPVNSVRLSGNL